jgi:hypothetical protein
VVNDVEKIRRLGVTPVLADLLDSDDAHVRHDPVKLALAIAEIAIEKQTVYEWESEPSEAVGEEALLAVG